MTIAEDYGDEIELVASDAELEIRLASIAEVSHLLGPSVGRDPQEELEGLLLGQIELLLARGPLAGGHGTTGYALIEPITRPGGDLIHIRLLWSSREGVRDKLMTRIEDLARERGYRGVAWVGGPNAELALRNGYEPALVEYAKEV